MKRRLTILWLACIALVMAGSGTMWGQAYKNGYVSADGKVDVRRGDANAPDSKGYITNADNVNNEFGAGESAIIGGNGVLTVPNTNPLHTVQNVYGTLLVGSQYSQNVVMNIFDNGGGAAGQIINVHFKDYQQTAWPVNWIAKEATDRMYFPLLKYDATKDIGDLGLFTGGTGSTAPPVPAGSEMLGFADALNGNYYGSVFAAVKIAPDAAVFPIHNHVSNWDKTSFKINLAGMGDNIYTSTVDLLTGNDDGKQLWQTIPGPQSNYANYAALAGVTGSSYIRPTTVMVSGVNSFGELRMSDIGWWWMSKEGTLGAPQNMEANFNASGCVHFSGKVYYQRQDATFENKGMYQLPDAYVDGAIRFLNNSRTCVAGNATNATTQGKSKAYLVFPKEEHFALRVGGDFGAFPMYVEDRTVAAEDKNGWYSKSGAPAYPTTTTADIFLMPGTAPWAADWKASHTYPQDNGISAHLGPNKQVTAGIWGVNGTYAGTNANIHTSKTAAGADDNDGVIEVGEATKGTYNKFFVYSGGTFKNYGGCVNISQAIDMRGAAPAFKMDKDQPLNILNDGGNDPNDYQNASILLGGAGLVSLNAATSAPTGKGALHVQAKGKISTGDLNNPIGYGSLTINAAQNNNNAAFISELSFVEMGDLIYQGGAGAGAGYESNLTVWARGEADHRNNKFGNVRLGKVEITSPQADANNTWNDPLKNYVPINNTNLIRDLYCKTDLLGSNPAAYDALDAKLQTRIQSQNDGVTINGEFNYSGKDGSLLVQGAGNVVMQKDATLQLEGKGDVAIQSKSSTVDIRGKFAYTTNQPQNDVFIDGEQGAWLHHGAIDMATATGSNVAVQSNQGDVWFRKKTLPTPVDFQVTFGGGNTAALDLWAGQDLKFDIPFTSTENADKIISNLYAGRDILSATDAHLTFNSTADIGSKLTMIGRRNITLSGKLTANYTGNTQTQTIAVQAMGGNITTDDDVNVKTETDNYVLFSAEMIDCGVQNGGNAGYTGCDPGNRNSKDGNIWFNDSVIINRLNTGHGTTDFLAVNNLRSASVKVMSKADEDTVNVISHKGNIWLGYSAGKSEFDVNRFLYRPEGAAGELLIKAGFDDVNNKNHDGGANISFTQIDADMKASSTHNMTIQIPFSNEYLCGDACDDLLHARKGESMMRYEHAGIIGGVGRCGVDKDIAKYSDVTDGTAVMQAPDKSIVYRGNNGNLTVDAGQRGNIIMNTGTELDFQNNKGSAFFRTRFGDIDLRNKTNVQGLRGSLLLLAQTDDLSDLAKVGFCGCAEERNNVYLQDFQYTPNDSSGSIFIGADNNIKLNYGGLQNKGTRHDPFLSTDYNPTNPGEKIGTDYPCGSGKYHCDMVDDENQARPLMLDFSKAVGPAPISIAQGGFAAVASDYIDVYKTMIYKGGKGSGMSDVPGEGTLHGENVAGYGLYMKTQGNKNNWNTNILKYIPKCPMGCEGGCDKGDYLHMVSRMTFHSDARIYAHDQKVFLASPVIEVFGDLELNTKDEEGTRTEIVLQADSLILHDSLIVTGDKLKYRSWSGINGDKPIMKFGYSRRTPPVQEFKYKDIECAPCYSYIPGSTDPKHMLDTITIKFKHGDTFVERFNTVVFDHTVLTFVTDSFDHVQGPPILNARFFIDTLKVRNQVALYADAKHEHDAHFELISEEQMQSKNYAGVYTRHYHMEPIGACGRNYSELWLSDDKALDVITTSTFGGFGYQHSDVHVETEAHLNPGFTSLRLRGQCYEQKCGTLKMKDLRLDGGAQLHFSVGTTKGINGEYSDAIDVEKLTTYGTVDVNIEVRPCERMENRCYPIIYYKSQTPGSLNNLNLVPKTMKIDGVEVPLALDVSQEGVVYVCVGNVAPPTVVHSVTIPSVAGVTTTPPTGIAYAVSHSNFEFKAKYSTEKPFVVRTNRMFNGETEVLEGKKNSNGEYEYVIRQVTQNIVLKFGPDYVANMSVNGTAVWSHGETIYIRVEREDIASIYSVAGQLVKRVELPEGDTPIPMQRGVYVVTLKDGSVHKVIVK